MNRFGCLIVAALATAAVPADLRSQTLVNPQGTVEILIGGAPQRRYLHNGRWYVEALKGREYAIRLRNPYGVRVAVAVTREGRPRSSSTQAPESGGDLVGGVGGHGEILHVA